MSTWIALLRGVNVVGRNKVPMKDLAACLEGAGFAAVRTYIQSGNVVFGCARGTARSLSARIGRAMHAEFGFAPCVKVITPGELALAVRGNPFPGAQRNHKALHLYFLSERADGGALDALALAAAARESLALRGEVLYFYTPEGFGVSTLRPKLERCLGEAATARNWRTVNELLDMARRHAQENPA